MARMFDHARECLKRFGRKSRGADGELAHVGISLRGGQVALGVDALGPGPPRRSTQSAC
jgi:hypothetical protein